MPPLTSGSANRKALSPTGEFVELPKQLAADVDTLRYDIVRPFQNGNEVSSSRCFT
ncbi:hypothetical protein [Amycolatopsis samaneae]|uniref:Uncharacterized protein n=1 Tax=Amycolatopsis samaneae TaxID=664691 RepID=A0ABW5GA41_9PSEU